MVATRGVRGARQRERERMRKSICASAARASRTSTRAAAACCGAAPPATRPIPVGGSTVRPGAVPTRPQVRVGCLPLVATIHRHRARRRGARLRLLEGTSGDDASSARLCWNEARSGPGRASTGRSSGGTAARPSQKPRKPNNTARRYRYSAHLRVGRRNRPPGPFYGGGE